MSAEAYQRLLRERKEQTRKQIESRARYLRRTIRVLTLSKMIEAVNLMRNEIEQITRSNRL